MDSVSAYCAEGLPIKSRQPTSATWHVENTADCHADLYTVSRCCTRGESQEFMACRWQSTQVRDPPWLWNPGETSSEVQNRGISGSTKRTHVLQKFLKKKKKKKKLKFFGNRGRVKLTNWKWKSTCFMRTFHRSFHFKSGKLSSSNLKSKFSIRNLFSWGRGKPFLSNLKFSFLGPEGDYPTESGSLISPWGIDREFSKKFSMCILCASVCVWVSSLCFVRRTLCGGKFTVSFSRTPWIYLRTVSC